MKLYDHKYMSFILRDDRIDFVWKPQTEDMDDHGFQYSILRYASYVMEYNCKKVLIDLTEFKFTPSEASGKFHSDYVTPIYNMVGVTKKVFVAPFMENKVIGKEPGTDYDNAFMKSNDDAVAACRIYGRYPIAEQLDDILFEPPERENFAEFLQNKGEKIDA